MLRKKSARIGVAAALDSLVIFASGASAYADSWTRGVDCGTGKTANMTTTSTVSKAVEHSYNGILRGLKSTGGTFATSKPNQSGDVYAGAWTAGSFSAHTAGCFCPSGMVCGS